MALNPGTKWPTRVTAPAAGYPYGSSKDETAPGANDGTPYEKARADDLFGFQQAILESLGIVPSGNAETSLLSQYLQGIVQYSGGKASYYDDSGAADAYVVDGFSAQYVPDAYFAGQIVSFIPDNDNTGASTINVNSLGVKSIKRQDGTAVAGGEILSGEIVTLVYDGTNFQLWVPPSEGALKAWVSFDGSGVVAINDSVNVSSITDNGTGNYDINFTTAFANANYAWVGTARDNDDVTNDGNLSAGASDTKTTGVLQVITTDSGGSAIDSTEVCVMVIGAQ